MTGAGLEKMLGPEHFQKGSSQLEYGKGDLIRTQKTSALAGAFSVRQIDGSLDVKLSLRGGSTGPSREGMLQKDDREGIVHRLLERPVHERKGRTRSLLVPFLSLRCGELLR